MRIIVSGPRGWKNLATRAPTRTKLVEEWLEGNLRYLEEKHCSIAAASTLHLGLDTMFAEVCYRNNIPYDVILSCPDQHKYWDEDSQKNFARLLGAARSVSLIGEDTYLEGCIHKQSEAIMTWLLDSEPGMRVMLLLKQGKLSKTQTERVGRLRHSSTIISVFNW